MLEVLFDPAKQQLACHRAFVEGGDVDAGVVQVIGQPG